MKKLIIIIIAALFILAVSFTIFRYFGAGFLFNQTDSEPAISISELKGKVVDEDLSRFFTGFDGCFVLLDKKNNVFTIFNEAGAQKRVSPCSTFKIINSLIGLETKVVEDENTVFKWNGKHNSIEEWNKDHSMASAFKNSVVWYYQEVASKVGKEKMQDYLNKVDYGNNNISGGQTKFWLYSSLKISPIEQVLILNKFYSYQLPFSKGNIDIVKKIMVWSDNNGIKYSGKSGSAGVGLGWFVGYVEKEGNVHIFATKIQGNKADGVKARRITEEILKDKELFEGM